MWCGWSKQRLARQLANPHGVFGRQVATKLNELNRSRISAAVSLLGLRPGQNAADVGFGGGLGVHLLLDAVGPSGVVHGIDRSDTAVAIAERKYADHVTAGRLRVHLASMTELPLDGASLDGVITVNTVYFLDDKQLDAAFREFARILRPGGRVVVGIGNPEAMAADPLMAHGFRIRPVHVLVAHAVAAGLGHPAQQEIGGSQAPAYLIGLTKS